MRKNLAPNASRSPEKDGLNHRIAMIAPPEAIKVAHPAAAAADVVVIAAPVVTSTMNLVVQPPGKPR